LRDGSTFGFGDFDLKELLIQFSILVKFISSMKFFLIVLFVSCINGSHLTLEEVIQQMKAFLGIAPWDSWEELLSYYERSNIIEIKRNELQADSYYNRLLQNLFQDFSPQYKYFILHHSHHSQEFAVHYGNLDRQYWISNTLGTLESKYDTLTFPIFVIKIVTEFNSKETEEGNDLQTSSDEDEIINSYLQKHSDEVETTNDLQVNSDKPQARDVVPRGDTITPFIRDAAPLAALLLFFLPFFSALQYVIYN
jgi:hypothetical protein